MPETDHHPSIGCTLTDEEVEERAETVRTTLASIHRRTEERPEGHTYTFDGSDGAIRSVAAFVERERTCCSFAEYSIEVSPPYDEVRLTVTGPDGTKEALGTPIAALLEAVDVNELPGSDGSGEPTGPSGARPDASDLDAAERRKAVRARYGAVAAGSGSGCCSAGGDASDADDRARLMGYGADDVDAVSPGANLGLGCGNPTGIAGLDEGDVVLDLGSGAGFDCLLAAREVGSEGRVIGVDMTPEMVETARENAAENGVSNVEFRLGEIEHLPVADGSIDVIISNCVVNLSPDKPRVFEEAFRVLKPGGRLAISDVVETADLPPDVRADPSAVTGCVAGGATVDELESMLANVGFDGVAIAPTAKSDDLIRTWDDQRDLSDYVVSVTIEGEKPTS